MSEPHLEEEEETLIYVILDTKPLILCLLTMLVATAQDYRV